MPERRPIPGYPGYEIEADGTVWSSRQRRPLAHRMTPRLDHHGYPRVSLVGMDGRALGRPVHSLVALAFIGSRPPGAQVNHKDGNKLNAHPENLEYVSSAENHHHATVNGLKPRGERVNTAKLTAADVLQIRRLFAEGASCRAIAERYRLHHKHVNNIVARRDWKHIAEPQSEAPMCPGCRGRGRLTRNASPGRSCPACGGTGRAPAGRDGGREGR